MTRVGLIARADMGGLATLTHAFFEHMQPAYTVVLDMGNNARGGRNVLSYAPPPGSVVEHAKWRTAEIGHAYERMVDAVDVIYTAETAYDPRLYAIAHARRRVPIVLHAMPELLGPGERSGADAIWYPTNWRTSDGDIIMPVPTVDVVDEPTTPLPERVFFHTCGEAMLDRNGTEIVRQALAYVTQRCTVLLRCGEHVDVADWPSGPHGNVSIHVMPPADHYRNVFPLDAEVLLMPRRYGGLCLPVQEAAARGIPSIMSDLPPQNEWPGVATVRAEVLQQTVEMKGGWFPVHHVDPREYAAAIDRWADPDNVAELHKHAHAAHEWAVEHEWVRWRGRYTRALQAVAEAA